MLWVNVWVLWTELTYSLLANINVHFNGHSDSMKGREFFDFMMTVCLSRKIILRGISWFWKMQYNVDSDVIYTYIRHVLTGVSLPKWYYLMWSLGAFQKHLRRTITTFVLSVHPSVPPSARNNATPSRRIFVIFHVWDVYWNFFPHFTFV